MKTDRRNDKDKNPPNCYKVGDSWIVEFVFHGERFRESVGDVSKTVAGEMAKTRRSKCGLGELVVNGKRWDRYGKQWITETSVSKITDPLFEDAMTKYLAWYKGNRREYTYARYAVPSSKALKASFDGKRLSQISPFAIEAHKLARKREAEPGEERKAVSDCTINHELTLLRHLFNKAIEWKLTPTNPMDKVELFRLDNGRTRYLTQAEAEKLLAACAPDLRLLVLMAMHTGFRKSELKSLKWQSVDLVNNSVTVESCYSKNGEPRTVPLTDDLATALKKVKDERKPAADALVFLYEGQPWKTWRRSFRTALKNAGIKDFRFHDLRHCFGSWLAMASTANKAHMELMGHRDPKMTLRYSHISVEYKRQATAKLPQFGKSILEADSPEISPQEEKQNVVAFGR